MFGRRMNWMIGVLLPAFYGSRMFITVFTTARHWCLFLARIIRSTTCHFISRRSILILFSNLRLPNTPSWRGAQLKPRDHFTFTFNIKTYGEWHWHSLCMHTYVHTYIHTYIQLHSYIHTYTHTHTHTHNFTVIWLWCAVKIWTTF